VLVPASQGPHVWDLLLEEGAPLQIACVGLEAIEHLTATRRLHGIGQPAAPAPPD
jgi:glycine cleavage system aminomethyltransferase T